MEFIKNNFFKSAEIIGNFLRVDSNYEKMQDVIKLITEKHIEEYKGLVCGNGGSATEAMHYAEELTGRFRKDRRALAAISLTDVSHVTCVGNDYGFDQIFSRAIEAIGKRGDYLIAISTSGNSMNIIKAAEMAKSMNILTIGLLGHDGGAAKELMDYSFIVSAETSDRIQEVHMLIIHTMIEGIERLMFNENY